MLPFLLIPFFLCLLLFIPVTFRIYYLRNEQDGFLELDIYFVFRIFGFRIKVPEIKNNLIPIITEIQTQIENLVFDIRPIKLELEKEINLNQKMLERLNKIITGLMDKNQIKILVNSLNPECKIFNLQIIYGISNSMVTAVTYGFLGSIIGSTITLMERIFSPFMKREIELVPEYNKNKLEIDFESIFSLTLGNIILTVIKLLFYRLGGRKNV
ncbi:MAG: DUF2953 domain-containing protein [Halanaerobiales bacterium]